MFKSLRKWLLRKAEQQKKRNRDEKILNEQGCICWCPSCDEPLNNTNPAFVDKYGFVVYHCECGEKSAWLFDAPVPIYVNKYFK